MIRLGLIALAVALIGVLLGVPLCVVFHEAFHNGWQAYGHALSDPDTRSALFLSVLVVLLVVPLNTAFGIAAAQSAFVNTLMRTLAWSAPDVDPRAVIATGSTEIRMAFGPDQVPGILVAYMAGLRVAFAIMIGLSGASFLLSFFQGWERIPLEEHKD